MFAEEDIGGMMSARQRVRRPGWAALLLVAMALPLGLLGCGSGDDTSSGDSTTAGGFAPQIVTDDDIKAQDDGSPGRSLLEWWQAFQFQDSETVVALTSQDTLDELGKKNLEELVKTRGAGLQGIEILGTSDNGDTASVRSGLLTFQPENPGDPPPDEPTASRPITFTMERDGDQWLFDTPTYLQPQIDSLQQADEQSNQGSEGK